MIFQDCCCAVSDLDRDDLAIGVMFLNAVTPARPVLTGLAKGQNQ